MHSIFGTDDTNLSLNVGVSRYTRFNFTCKGEPIVLVFLEGIPGSGQQLLLDKWQTQFKVRFHTSKAYTMPQHMETQNHVRFNHIRNILWSLIPNKPLPKNRGTCIIMDQSPFSHIVWLMANCLASINMAGIFKALEHEAQSIYHDLTLLGSLLGSRSNLYLHFVHCRAAFTSNNFLQTDKLFSAWLDQLSRIINHDTKLRLKDTPEFKAVTYICDKPLEFDVFSCLETHIATPFQKIIKLTGSINVLDIKQMIPLRKDTTYYSSSESDWESDTADLLASSSSSSELLHQSDQLNNDTLTNIGVATKESSLDTSFSNKLRLYDESNKENIPPRTDTHYPINVSLDTHYVVDYAHNTPREILQPLTPITVDYGHKSLETHNRFTPIVLDYQHTSPPLTTQYPLTLTMQD